MAVLQPDCQPDAQSQTEAWSDQSLAEPDLDQIVEHPLVAGGGVDPGVDEGREVRESGGHERVPQVAGDSGGAAEAVADGETGLVMRQTPVARRRVAGGTKVTLVVSLGK